MLSTLPLIIIALLSLSVLILVHEIGHFLAAIISGVWAEEFGIGLPPRIKGKKFGKTIYSINWLPIGGFVRLHGEDPSSKVSKPREAFTNKSKLTKIFIALAGVVMNFVLAIICFTTIYWFTGVPRGVKILEVSPESPAEVAGIKSDDIILSLNENNNLDYITFSEKVAENIGQSVTITFQREEEGKLVTKTTDVIIRSEIPENEGPLGVSFTSKEIYYPSFWNRPFVFLYYGTVKTVDISGKILEGLILLFQQLLGGTVPKGVAGPVGVTALLAEVTKLGFLPLIEFIGIISINLALINLVPFPPLDGSRVLFIVLESVFGKRILPKLESASYTAGMIILLGLMVALTANEIPKLLTAGSLSNFVNLILQ